MKPRRVIVTMEIETDLTLAELRDREAVVGNLYHYVLDPLQV